MLYILIVITIIRKKEDIYLVRIINEFNFRLVSFFFEKLCGRLNNTTN